MWASRWFAVGSADQSEQDPGGSAAARALAGDDAKLLIVFASPSQDLRALLRQIRARAGDVPLIGCSAAGEIATGGGRDASVVVAALGGDGFAIQTAVAGGARRHARGVGAAVARRVPWSEGRPHRALLLLTDGLAGGQQEILTGAYGVLGAGVPLVGGCAGNDGRIKRTFQFYGDRVLTNSVVAAGIASNAPLGVGVRHGWRSLGETLVVTRSSANRVYTLDDRPALDVYLEQLELDEDGLDENAFPALALTHPIGLSRPRGEEQIRFVRSADFGDGSLACRSEIPQGGLVRVMAGDAASVLSATDAACEESVTALGGLSPLGALAFDCTERRELLGERGTDEEFDRLVGSVSGAPLAGFYTYGEIARTRGVRGFHNQTLVVLTIA
jgi:hypothetical protein